MKIDIKQTLEFFDGKHENDRGHASGVVGIIGEDLNAACFKHYMEDERAIVIVLDSSVTTGKKKGKRLDRWIYVKKEKTETLYQSEIKNWSSWAIGGKRLPVDATDEEVLEATQHYWLHEKKINYNGDDHPNGVTKVLVPMKVPKEYERKNVRVEPLLIYWMPISNTEKADAFFSVPVSEITDKVKTRFEKLNIFSTSLYLRELLKKGIRRVELDIPNVEGRMKVLGRIVIKIII